MSSPPHPQTLSEMGQGGGEDPQLKAKLRTGGQCAPFITEKETEFTRAFVYYAKKQTNKNNLINVMEEIGRVGKVGERVE